MSTIGERDATWAQPRWRNGVPDLLLRAALPATALLLFGGFALLWASGEHGVYFRLLRFLAADPFRFPFVDTHAVLSAAECHRRGIDVYVYNPCDVLLRPHAFTPLWLSIVPGFLGTADTTAVGSVLDVLFLLSLAVLFRPRARGEVLICGLAVFSTAVLYAVERGNNDIVVYLLILASLALLKRGQSHRFFAYSLFLFAGLLKYYPLVLLALALRERGRALAIVVAGALLALTAFLLFYNRAVLEALANIPAGSYFQVTFWALNLPLGLAAAAGLSGAARGGVGLLLLLALVAGLLLTARRNCRRLAAAPIDWREPEMACLVAACLVVPFCFFAGQSNLYRGIFLLLAVPGLLRLQGAAESAARVWLQRLTAALILALWGGFVQHALQFAAPGSSLFPAAIVAQCIFWLAYQLLWWWLVAGLVSLAFLWSQTLPPLQVAPAWWRR